MVKLGFPTAPAQLTPEWLTQVLCTNGAAHASSVTSYDMKIIGEGTGFLGELAHLTLHYDRPAPSSPSSLIAKFPAAAQENRETSFEIPAAAFAGVHCGISISASVVAFNDAGSSAPSVESVAVDYCFGPSPSSSPATTRGLPGTGTGTGTGTASSQVGRGAVMCLLIGSSMLGAGLALLSWSRARRRYRGS